MVTRNTTFACGEHYHVYNRGNSKQNIFLDHSDYQRFIDLLFVSNATRQFNIRDILKIHTSIFDIDVGDPLVKISAYCLMPNHFHLLVSPLLDDGLSKFMLKLGTAYSMYFNIKYERSGTLYESRFKAKHADSDNYLKYLFSYIHLNPVYTKDKKTGVKKLLYTNLGTAYTNAVEYKYSSLKTYVDINTYNTPKNKALPRAALGLIDTSVFAMYFSSSDQVKCEVFDWLQYEEPSIGDG